jgi:hypothetical protein
MEKTKTLKPYKCKKCNEEDITKFIDGRYTVCKKCRSVKSKENTLSSESIKPDSDDKIMEKYLRFDYTIFNGYSVKQYIEMLHDELKESVKELKECKLKISVLENQLDKIKFTVNEKFIQE